MTTSINATHMCSYTNICGHCTGTVNVIYYNCIVIFKLVLCKYLTCIINEWVD